MADHLHATDLGLDTTTDEGLFGWFLASLLFGRPIQEQVAAHAWRLLIADGYTSPQAFISAGQNVIDHELWQGNYRRLVGVMAEELPRIMKGVVEKYGSVRGLVSTAASVAQLQDRLQEFRGVGPKTAEIFTREIPATELATSQPED